MPRRSRSAPARCAVLWETDRATRLEGRVERLEQVTVSQKLGTYLDKANRSRRGCLGGCGKRWIPRGGGRCPNGRVAGESGSRNRYGARVPRAPGNHGRHLRTGRRTAGGDLEGHLRALSSGVDRSRCATYAPGVGRGRRRMGCGLAGGQAGYAGRNVLGR